jgi:cardiolipin synthase (CMP-forming)
MTLANKVTIGRIFMIPVFVWLAIYYAKSVKDGAPVEAWRWAAIAAFVLASVSDGVDGYIARRFNQRSRLGVILDPLADKGLLLAAIITLSVVTWPQRFPTWFPIVIISRDAIIITGSLLVHYFVGKVEIRAHWTGKCATFLQMVAIGWLMLLIETPSPMYPTVLAAVFTVVSGVIYFTSGLRQANAAGHGSPDQQA